MKFALVDGERREAQPHLSGKCELHGCSVIARCGEVNAWHWAHIGKLMCDQWWEPETPWHIAWKGQFPKEWHEVVHSAKNGEKHIADVKTEQGYVIEFQHSHLDPQERVARESFYQNMVWVVDGTRLKRDYPRFVEGAKNFRPIGKPGYFLIPFPEECFPTAWVKSSVEVVFDFQGISPTDPQDGIRNGLWCLLPGRIKEYAVMIAIRRQDFITTTMNQPRLFKDTAHELVNALDKLLTKQEETVRFQPQNRRWQPRKPHRAVIPNRHKRK